MPGPSHEREVLCPIEGRNGRTHWLKMGTAFQGADGSWDLYLTALPTNGKLRICADPPKHCAKCIAEIPEPQLEGDELCGACAP